MSLINILEKRRSYYQINKDLPVVEKEVIQKIKQITELVPDAFNMKSSKIVVVLHEKQDELWNTIYDCFDGKISKDKINSFRSGAGTILFFFDEMIVSEMEKEFPLYAKNFESWAVQSSAMLQINLWSGLREMEIGASIQHYNPLIDDRIKKLYNLPSSIIW